MPPPCRDFNSSKGCHAADCKYPHVKPGTVPCEYFVKTGNCRDGDKCPFLHSTPKKDDKAVVDQVKKRSREDAEQGEGMTMAIKPPLYPPSGWHSPKPLILFRSAPLPSTSGKVPIAAFDMDDTLITTKSGNVFPKSVDDWKWIHPKVVPKLQSLHAEGFALVIISNQGKMASEGEDKANELKEKIDTLAKSCEVPLFALVVGTSDQYRKPYSGAWKLLCDCFGGAVDNERSFYVGDAAGRTTATMLGNVNMGGKTKDFSCSDRKFAWNAGIPFFTPEEYFLDKKPKEIFEWGDVNPQSMDAVVKGKLPRDSFHKSKKDMVLMVGFPASGKSSFYRNYLKPFGYSHANRDTLKTQEKCIAVANEALSKDGCVCIDNTNPDPADRQRYISVAKKHGATVRCIVMDVSMEWAMHLNQVRSTLGIAKSIPTMVYNGYKKKYVEPTVKEGFDEVIKVPLVLNAEGLSPLGLQLVKQLA